MKYIVLMDLRYTRPETNRSTVDGHERGPRPQRVHLFGPVRLYRIPISKIYFISSEYGTFSEFSEKLKMFLSP